jgi:hypothetical protein
MIYIYFNDQSCYAMSIWLANPYFNPFLAQEHILGFMTCLYDYVLIRKDICD